MTAALRRGACPRLAEPMRTGDGLLVRFAPVGTMGLDHLSALCAAARRHGSGIVEITRRGSIQVRGLTVDTAAAFAREVAALDIDIHDGVPVVIDPLSGLDPGEVLDAGGLAAQLRAPLADQGLRAALSPKASIVIDGGGALGLDAIPADVRLRAVIADGAARWEIRLGGTAADSCLLGAAHPDNAPKVVVELVRAIAARGPQARGADIVRAPGIDAFAALSAPCAVLDPPERPRPPDGDPIGVHPLRNARAAVGIGLAFGHVHVDDLDRLIDAARRSSAAGMRTAPGRVLLVIDVPAERIETLRHHAESAGLIARPDDRRRFVVACAGAPICASGAIPTRRMAPLIAAASAPLLDGSVMLHLSGCPKGCAHSGVAGITIVGDAAGCALVVNGSVRDRPVGRLPVDDLAARIAGMAAQIARARRSGEPCAEALGRLGAAAIREAGRA